MAVAGGGDGWQVTKGINSATEKINLKSQIESVMSKKNNET